MSGQQVVGVAILAAAIVGLFALVAGAVGWRAALFIWASAFSLTAVVALGSWLLAGGAA